MIPCSDSAAFMNVLFLVMVCKEEMWGKKWRGEWRKKYSAKIVEYKLMFLQGFFMQYSFKTKFGSGHRILKQGYKY
jgi:hypothetical protein